MHSTPPSGQSTPSAACSPPSVACVTGIPCLRSLDYLIPGVLPSRSPRCLCIYPNLHILGSDAYVALVSTAFCDPIAIGNFYTSVRSSIPLGKTPLRARFVALLYSSCVVVSSFHWRTTENADAASPWLLPESWTVVIYFCWISTSRCLFLVLLRWPRQSSGVPLAPTQELPRVC